MFKSNIEDILTRGSIIELIRRTREGELDDYLPQLKDHNSALVRRAIAYRGMYLDQYINDKYATVREAVIKADPSYVPIMVQRNDPDDNDTLVRWMTRDTIIDKDLWKIILARPDFEAKLKHYLPGDLYALNIVKQIWDKGELDALSKTMTRKQLYLTNNPFWAYKYSLIQIDLFPMKKTTDDDNVLDECFAYLDNYYN